MQKFQSKLLQKNTEYEDERGSLIAWESDYLPFSPMRTFLISNVPSAQTRANHSVNCDLVITAIYGTVKVELDHTQIFMLETKAESLWVRSNTFIVLKEFSSDASILVFAEKSFNDTLYSGS
jgi:hypothetical protein